MNKFLLVISTALFSLTMSMIFADELPKSFRQTPWGVNVNQLSDMEVADPGGSMSMYTKKNDVMQVGEADIVSLYYGFYNDRFYSVYITFKNPDNYSKIKDALVQEYGDPDKTNLDREKYTWDTEGNIAISLDYNQRHQTGNVTYLFKPISEQQEKDNSL